MYDMRVMLKKMGHGANINCVSVIPSPSTTAASIWGQEKI